MPNLEFALLYLLTKSKEYGTLYFKIYDNILLSDELKRIYKYILKYYKTYAKHDYISKDEFLTYFLSENPVLKQKDQYIDLINRIYSQDISESLASDVMRKYAAKVTAERICQHLFPVLDGSEPERVSEIAAILDEYRAEIKDQDGEESPFIEDDIDQLFETEVDAPGISWPLECLNQNVGHIRRGNLIHIFARPNQGKTSLLANILAHAAPQLEGDEVIILVGNEEKGRRLKVRINEAVLGMTEGTIKEYRQKGKSQYLKDLFNERGGNRIKVFYNAATTLEDIKRLLDRYNTRLLAIDIADHVKFRDASDKKVEFLEELYRKYRILADIYNIDIITTGQADNASAGKKTIFIENMNNSKTGKQGALDIAIAIGSSYDKGEEDLRWINVVKNKQNSDGGSGPFTVRFDKTTGLYYDF